jgi:hypothetical protein
VERMMNILKMKDNGMDFKQRAVICLIFGAFGGLVMASMGLGLSDPVWWVLMVILTGILNELLDV